MLKTDKKRADWLKMCSCFHSASRWFVFIWNHLFEKKEFENICMMSMISLTVRGGGLFSAQHAAHKVSFTSISDVFSNLQHIFSQKGNKKKYPINICHSLDSVVCPWMNTGDITAYTEEQLFLELRQSVSGALITGWWQQSEWCGDSALIKGYWHPNHRRKCQWSNSQTGCSVREKHLNFDCPSFGQTGFFNAMFSLLRFFIHTEWGCSYLNSQKS